MNKQDDQQNFLKTLSLIGQLGLWMVASIILFGLSGYHLGRHFAHATEGLIIGVLLGVLAGFNYSYKKILQTSGLLNGDSKK